MRQLSPSMPRLWTLLALAVAFGLGRWLAAGPAEILAPPAAMASETVAVSAGQRLVSTDGGTAYLWHFDGQRVELLGVTKAVEGGEGQAAFVWMPGVERRK
ncbi:MAG: hypothetical protein KC591_08500 [Gemmatimonadetes bacterium]|nr:hypothetical protein [Gemmatimonadota bacterium]